MGGGAQTQTACHPLFRNNQLSSS